LLDPCHEADPATSAFVQATVIDPVTGKLSVYNPLVVDDGTEPAVPPVVPQLPAGAVVGVWFGFNGDNLTLRGSQGSLTKGACVNGLKGSIFGQFAYCGAPRFFATAHQAIGGGKLTVPAPGTASDGLPCPTTRDFAVVDMDQSDNVTTNYLFLPDGRTAQNTAANQAALTAKGAKVQVNGSDEGLLDNFIDPALGCTPYRAPDLADPGHEVTSLALNELQAGHQAAPVALVPTTDPMTLVDGKPSVDKTNMYRAGVGQPPIDPAVETPKGYCRSLVDIGVARTRDDADRYRAVRSPNAADATNLFTFLAQRLNASFTELGCGKLLRMANPVTVITDANGVAIDARFATITPSPSPSRPSPSPSSVSPSSPCPSPSATPPSPPSPSPTGTPSSTDQPTAMPGTTAPPAGTPGATTPASTSRPVSHPTPTTVPTTQAAPPPPPPPPPATTATGGGGPVRTGAPSHTPDGGAPVPAGSGDAVPVAGPAPSLTLGPVPVRAGTRNAADGGDSSMPLPKLAGIGLLGSGLAIGLGVWIRAMVNRRRERWSETY
jgi:hypothetical protein